MNIRQKIFWRVLILAFFMNLIISIGGWYLELQHNHNKVLNTNQGRFEILADMVESLELEQDGNYLQNVVGRLGVIEPTAQYIFVEKDGKIIISSDSKDDLQIFLGWATPSKGRMESRNFSGAEGIDLLDVVSKIKAVGPNDSDYLIHIVLNLDSVTKSSLSAVWPLVWLGLLMFLLSIPAAWFIARLTTREVSQLTDRLDEYQADLETEVARRTKTLHIYKGIIASTNDHMAFVDTNYNYQLVNSGYMKSHNKTEDEIIGKSVADLFGVDAFNDLIKDRLDQCLTGETVKYRVWLEFHGLGQRYMDVVYDPYLAEDGTIAGVVVSSRDITLLHVAQETLRETEARYRSLFDCISNGAAIYSAVDNGRNFKFVDYNKAGQIMDKTPKDEVIGQLLTDVFPEVKKIGLLDVLRRVWGTGVSEDLPVTIYEDNKVLFWRHNTVYKLPSGEIVAVYSDETERMVAEEIMRAEHARFEAVLESLDAVVYAADMNTFELLFANKAVRDQFGEIIGQTCWKAIQEGQTEQCQFCTNDRLLDADGRPKEPYIWEVQNTVDGRWYQCNDQAIQWPDGRMVRLEIATDITDRKRSEEVVRLHGRNLKGLSDAAHLLLGAVDEIPLQNFIEIIGPCSNASRAYIFMNHKDPDGQLMASQKGEWCAPGIPPESDNPILQNMSYEKWMPNWRHCLLNGEEVHATKGEFPDEEMKILGGQATKSVLILPVLVKEELVGFIGLDNCVSEKKWEESEVIFLKTAASDLAQTIRRLQSDKKVRAALNEKDVLLREIHHRVKNNMQVITSLLNLQARKISDEGAIEAIRESQDRIHVMSLVHETLYRSDDLSSIAMEHYLNQLTTDIARLHHGSDVHIRWHVDAGGVNLPINEAIPVGLVANELISNSFKHAFGEGKEGNIKIILRDLGAEKIELIVEDNGRGVPENFDMNGVGTLGLQLVSRLAEGQLGGVLNLDSKNGTRVSVSFVTGSLERE
jgi:PAS domain S-box-containing protein